MDALLPLATTRLFIRGEMLTAGAFPFLLLLSREFWQQLTWACPREG